MTTLNLNGEYVSLDDLAEAWAFWKKAKEVREQLKEIEVQIAINQTLSEAFKAEGEKE